MRKEIILIVAAAMLAFCFQRHCSKGLYLGELTTTENGSNTCALLIDKNQKVYYIKSTLAKESKEMVDYLRQYASVSKIKYKGDSLFIFYDSLVTRYSIIKSYVFGKQQEFVELHYDKNCKAIIKGKTNSNELDLQITEIRIGKDTISRHEVLKRNGKQ